MSEIVAPILQCVSIVEWDQLDRWPRYHLIKAWHVSTMSKDPSSQVGADITDIDLKRSISEGFNGLPPGMEDDSRLDDRAWKYRHIIHAEENALTYAHDIKTEKALFTYPQPPCTKCSSMLTGNNVTVVYTLVPRNKHEEDMWGRSHTVESILKTTQELNIKVVLVQNVPFFKLTEH